MTHEIPLSKQQSLAIEALPIQQSIEMHIFEKRVMILRLFDGLYAYENRCPHQSKQLSSTDHLLFDNSDTLIECEHHGAQFVPHTGLCVSGPCTGQFLTRITIHQNATGYVLLLSPEPER